IQPGQTVAIVCRTGAGNATLINLLMLFDKVDGGSIELDGIDITSVSRHDVRNKFGMVLQDTWLLNGTIRDNIAYGKKDANEEEVIQAAKTAYVDEFIRKLPKGYDTILNEQATNISQGERQLITIARSILADPAMMILYEDTTSFDTMSEVYSQQAMNQVMKTRTSFVIAHRLSTIQDADIILVMDQGTVIEQGNHETLLRENGF